MTIPRLERKWQLDASYTPRSFLDSIRALGWQPGIVPQSVIYTYARLELVLAADTGQYTPNHMLGTGPGRFFLVNGTDQQVAINCLGIGPSVTASQLELQAELGVQRFVILGTAGALSSAVRPGTIVIPTEAVRDDGTSDHYADPAVPAVPDPRFSADFTNHLAALGYEPLRGPTWTTAAPFRTTNAEVAHYTSHGVLTVEEEAAALFVVGSQRALDTAAALVVDRTAEASGHWTPDLAVAARVLHELLPITTAYLAHNPRHSGFEQGPMGGPAYGH